MTNELLWKLRKVHEEVGVVEDKLFYEFWPKALLSLLISMQSLWWWSSQAPCHLRQWAKNKQKKWTIWFLFSTKLVVTWHLSLEARLVLFMSTFWCQFFGVNCYQKVRFIQECGFYLFPASYDDVMIYFLHKNIQGIKRMVLSLNIIFSII